MAPLEVWRRFPEGLVLVRCLVHDGAPAGMGFDGMPYGAERYTVLLS